MGSFIGEDDFESLILSLVRLSRQLFLFCCPRIASASSNNSKGRRFSSTILTWRNAKLVHYFACETYGEVNRTEAARLWMREELLYLLLLPFPILDHHIPQAQVILGQAV